MYFVGSTTRKAYRVYNIKTLIVEESLHVAFDESNLFYPMQAHNEEEVNLESWESNLVPNNKE